MSEKITVAILGLGHVGQDFAEYFLEKVLAGSVQVEIVAVAHRHLDSPVAMGFSQSGVPVFENAVDVLSFGEKLDVIFDLTGDAALRHELRKKLQESDNHHTVIAPEVIARLMWLLFDEKAVFEGNIDGY